jgi:hypothetical protein
MDQITSNDRVIVNDAFEMMRIEVNVTTRCYIPEDSKEVRSGRNQLLMYSPGHCLEITNKTRINLRAAGLGSIIEPGTSKI